MRWLQGVLGLGAALAAASCASLHSGTAAGSSEPSTRSPERAAEAGQPPAAGGQPSTVSRQPSANEFLPARRETAAGRELEPAIPGQLPPIPLVDGPLAIRVIYPRARQVVSVRDSTFIFGSIGSGSAELTINGANVPVYPNGAFLGWLPFPQNTPPTYEIVARKVSGDSARLVHQVARPQPPSSPVESPQFSPVDSPRFVELLNANVDAKSDSDSVAILRPTAGGTYKWFLP
jgi:hypothetical protein